MKRLVLFLSNLITIIISIPIFFVFVEYQLFSEYQDKTIILPSTEQDFLTIQPPKASENLILVDLKIQSGDSFFKLAKYKMALSKAEIEQILQDQQAEKILNNIKVGKKFSVYKDQANKTQKIIYNYQKDKDLTIVYENNQYTAHYDHEDCNNPALGHITIAKGQGLIKAGRGVGLETYAEKIFYIFKNHKININSVHVGDSIRFAYACNKIKAIEFKRGAKKYYIIQYKNNYYTEQGVILGKKALLFIKPVKETRISSPYGYRIHPIDKTKKLHKGIDYAASIGTPIYASASGKIIMQKYLGSAGNTVIIQHNPKYKTRYLHLDHFNPKHFVGDYVQQGELIGYVGKTGRVTGAHLHFEVLINDKAANPEKYLNAYQEYIVEDMQAFLSVLEFWQDFFKEVNLVKVGDI